MKMLTTAMLGVAMVLFAAGAARADTLEVNVPFAFFVGGKKLPAGAYRIERNFETSSSLVRIRGEHGAATLFVQTTPMNGANAAHEAALVFVPDETANRLTAIFEPNGLAHEVSASRGASKQVGGLVVRAQPRS
jgi:hypothetical protein